MGQSVRLKTVETCHLVNFRLAEDALHIRSLPAQ